METSFLLNKPFDLTLKEDSNLDMDSDLLAWMDDQHRISE